MLLPNPLILRLVFLVGHVFSSATSIRRDEPNLPLPSNETVNSWPPEPFRFPLPDYKDGFLLFRRYGPSGSETDRNILISLLEMVTQANTYTPTAYSSPNVDVNIPHTSVFLRSRATAPPGFPSLSTKLALSTLAALKSLVGRHGAKEFFVDVHDGYLGYGPWAVMLQGRESQAISSDRQ